MVITQYSHPLVAENLSPMSIIGQVLIAILFAYDGWINVGALAGEMKNPGKDFTKSNSWWFIYSNGCLFS